MTVRETPQPWAQPLLVSDLSGNRSVDIDLRPTADQRLRIADDLGILRVRKLVFKGTLSPVDNSDWRLSAKLGATVVQSCIVTLEPVLTRIDEIVLRQYLNVLPEFEAGSELEMPADVTTEALGKTIDPVAVMVEALTLALPLFPKISGAELKESNFTEPGKTPMSDTDTRPFAQLGQLRDEQNNDTD